MFSPCGLADTGRSTIFPNSIVFNNTIYQDASQVASVRIITLQSHPPQTSQSPPSSPQTSHSPPSTPRPSSEAPPTAHSLPNPTESAISKYGRALNILASRKNGDATILAITDSRIAILQRLDSLSEFLAHDFELRENMRRLPDKFRTIGNDRHSRFAFPKLPIKKIHADDPERPSAEVPPIRV